ncbi:MAG: fasciclin domain-containing protein [Paludibacter sp.]|nr:fasciclin domain-containing protein [Paludibacter sp.]
MERNSLKRTVKKHLSIYCVFVLFIFTVVSSCVDEPLNINTFTQEMTGQYLQSRPAQFSEFVKLLDTTEVMGLMNTYGKYTLFAPNNEAMHAFYLSKGRTSLNGFPLDTLKKIAYDHIIKGYKVKTENFVDGLLPFLTMSDRYVSTASKTENSNLIYYVNDKSAIVTKDIETSNGIIQEIKRVLDPSVMDLVQAIAADTKFKLFTEALVKTGLATKLMAERDAGYDIKNYSYIDLTWIQGSGSKDELPLSRKYGFTALMESDATYDSYNIHSLEDLKAYAASHVYNEESSDASVTDITDPRNSLNKFIAYHLIDKKLTYTKFINDYDTDHMIKTFDMYEYIETMNPNTLIEIKKERVSGETNLINKSTETGDAVRIVTTNKDNDATNGVYHEIDKILIYDAKVAGELSGKRLRMDAASFFPELTNNNMRYYDPSKPRSWVYPQGYIKRLTCSATTRFCYLNAYGGYLDYEGDEVYLKGMYDFTVVTPPVPAGTYEVRFCYQPTGGRGAAQLYWDGVPCSIPLDLRILANDPLIGYVEPGTDTEDVNGYENDKMMRNRGYMKGPCTYKDILGVWYGKKVARQSSNVIRRILGTYTFSKSGTHLLSVKAVREGQFMMDFLEFVPVEMLENEGIE